MSLFADLSVSVEPAFPTLGTPIAGVLALTLVAVTIWTYLGAKPVPWRRISVLLIVRLLALALVFAMMFRPSFATTQLDGLAPSKLLVLWDASASMNFADVEGKPTRWQHAQQIWSAPDVQQRIRLLKETHQIDIVKYLAADSLKADETTSEPNGKRTDIGAWLHDLWQKHGHEKRLRGIALVSDGADNGLRFSALEKARQWRGVAPIFALGVGDTAGAKDRKDIAVTGVRAEPNLVPAKGKLVVKVIAHAPGFSKTQVRVSAALEDSDKKIHPLAEIAKFEITRERDLDIELSGPAPENPGEYKLTVKIDPQPGEANLDNNIASTYVQVVQEKINILWIDRVRVYEPTLAIRTLAGEKRFDVFHFTPPPTMLAKKLDPHAYYKLNDRHYNLIVIGDVPANRVSLSDPTLFDAINKLVLEKKTGLLMLGGVETFAKGGWDKIAPIANLLPVSLDAKPHDFVEKAVRVLPAPKDLGPYPFLRLTPDAKGNDAIWRTHFDRLEGFSPVGTPTKDSTLLLKGDGDEPILIARRPGEGRVAVFTADSTAIAWLGSPEAARGYQRFWKQLAYWLTQQADDPNQLWIRLDKRRLLLDADDHLGFTFGLRGRSGNTIKQANFTATITSPSGKISSVNFSREEDHQRGKFDQLSEPGEYKLKIEGDGKDTDGSAVQANSSMRFLVVADDIESLNPQPNHELMARIASASDGQFAPASEASLIAYLDRIAQQTTAEARMRTVHWPDWRRLPSSSSPRDQIVGAWGSFSFGVLALFASLLTGEWLLRKRWGMV